MGVEPWIDGKGVIVCAGAGGVGKTTVSATLALGLAAHGARVAVVTIDPARRLADALGLDELGNEPRLVDPGRLAAHGVALAPGGELWAMTLDPKHTFDELVEQLAPDAADRDEILANRIYQQLSSAVAGSQEFTAVAKLYELHASGRFDVLVLDTPPTRNALDFLDAPDRLLGFLEGSALRALLAPTGLAARIVGRGTGVVFAVLQRVTGVDLLTDLAVFFRSLGGLLDGFRARAAAVKALLGDPATTFVVVTSPAREPSEEAVFFAGRLRDADMPLGGVIVNRVTPEPDGPADPDAVAAALEGRLGAALARKVAAAHADARALAARDREAIARLARETGGAPLLLVPQLGGDVHDVGGLARLRERLFAAG
ncbi:MAG TPA: ArsA-related P-loop ATPase [Capillimicrobium sp.]|nr:ArsA-related P-loop ATPase [Capillimicrobium sp.]